MYGWTRTLTGLAVLAAVATTPAEAAERKTLLIAGGEVTGYYLPVAGALCRVINKERPKGMGCAVVPSSGSAANLAMLRAGEPGPATGTLAGRRRRSSGEAGASGV